MSGQSQRIRDLCQQWTQATGLGGTGGFHLGADTEAFRLHANQLYPADLDFDELRAAHIALSQIMIDPNYNTIVDRDHLLLWAWECELLIGRHGGWKQGDVDREFRSSVELAARQLFAADAISHNDPDAFEKRKQLSTLLNQPGLRSLYDGLELISYLAFPLLEGLLKRRAAQFVDIHGNVLAIFTVPTRNAAPNASYNVL